MPELACLPMQLQSKGFVDRGQLLPALLLSRGLWIPWRRLLRRLSALPTHAALATCSARWVRRIAAPLAATALTCALTPSTAAAISFTAATSVPAAPSPATAETSRRPVVSEPAAASSLVAGADMHHVHRRALGLHDLDRSGV